MRILFILMLAFSSSAWSACNYTLNPGDNVATAVNNASGGQTVCLNAGQYNTQTFDNIEHTSYVTVEPTVPGSNVYMAIDANTIGFIRFKGMKLGSTLIESCSHDFEIINNVWQEQAAGILLQSYGDYADVCGQNDKHVTISGNTLINVSSHGGEGKITVAQYDGVTISNNLIQGNIASVAIGDGIQTAGVVNNLHITGNTFRNLPQAPCELTPGVPHCDSIQIVAHGTGNVITGNFFDNVEVVLQHHDNNAAIVFEKNVIRNAVQMWAYSTDGDVNGSVFDHNTFINLGLMKLGVTGSDVSDTDTLALSNNIFLNADPHLCTGLACIASDNLFDNGAFGSGAITGTPIFVGGNPATITTYAGFALTTASPGWKMGSDGKDIGAIDTILPPFVEPVTPSFKLSFEDIVTDGNTTTYKDTSQNTRHCLTGGTSTPTVVTGKFGNGVQFDSGDFITCPWSNYINVDTNFTISAWVKTNVALTGPRTMLIRPASTAPTAGAFTNVYSLAVDNGYNPQKPHFGWEIDGSPYTYANRFDNVLPGVGEWHHYAVSYSPTMIKFYTDGIPVHTYNNTTSGYKVKKAFSPLLIGGATGNNVSGCQDCVIDEIVFYPQALTDAEMLVKATQSN